MDLETQVKWEHEMLSFGINRFRKQEATAVERKQYTQTHGGARLLKGYLAQVSEFIAHVLAGNSVQGRRGQSSKYARLVATVDADKLALFALTNIVAAVYEDIPMARVIQRIGQMIEDELKFTKFALDMPEYFDAVQRDMDRKNTANYRHRHRVLTHTMNKHGSQWRQWDEETRCGAGALILSLAMDSTDLVTKVTIPGRRSQKSMLVATPEVREWLENSNDAMALFLPDKMPCLIEPEKWTDTQTGGYYSPRLRMTTPLVKTRRGPAGQDHQDLLKDANMPTVLKAVNGMQGTAWRINKRVLETMQKVWDSSLSVGMPPSEPYEIPKCPFEKGAVLDDVQQEQLAHWKEEARELHTLEKKRQGNVMGVSRTMRIGQMLKDKKELYYVYQADFRGRLYSTASGVSPQGSDNAKAVLEFARSHPIGERGLYWLKVHGANKYGEDKCSYAERAKWIDARHEQWNAVAEDPIGNRAFWQDADKPYQFLAFCFEYAEATRVGAAFRTRLPIARDGSCNGLQHFSAMLRDHVGGAAVNLTPGDEPADIYQQVADVCYSKLKNLAMTNSGEGVAAQNWIKTFKDLGYDTIPRKVSKKPVMTLPYGSTQQACTSSIFTWYVEQRLDTFPENTTFKHCVLLSRLMWESIGEVVIAARAAMKWLQDSAAILGKDGMPLVYYSPLGFPVYQGSRKVDSKRVSARIGGSQMKVRIAVDTNEIDVRKQRQGSSPNMVHHVDATHLMRCVAAGVDAGIQDFAMIHDDFGVHACFIDEWDGIIRREFVSMHEDFDFLSQFKDAQEEITGLSLPVMPERGDLDLRDVLNSPYFFG